MKTISKRLLVLKKLKTKEKKWLQFCSDVPTTKTRKTPKHVEVKADSMVHTFPVTRVTRKNARGKR